MLNGLQDFFTEMAWERITCLMQWTATVYRTWLKRIQYIMKKEQRMEEWIVIVDFGSKRAKLSLHLYTWVQLVVTRHIYPPAAGSNHNPHSHTFTVHFFTKLVASTKPWGICLLKSKNSDMGHWAAGLGTVTGWALFNVLSPPADLAGAQFSMFGWLNHKVIWLSTPDQPKHPQRARMDSNNVVLSDGFTSWFDTRTCLYLGGWSTRCSV